MNAPPQQEAVADAGHTRTAFKEETCSAIVDESDEQRKFDRLQQRAGRAGVLLLKVPSGYMLVRDCASHHSSSLDALSLVLSAREDRA